ncbi:unnamed protein product [Hymenolepis diminuta]|uniref:Uncharacterized protein n=1 Tax=Hymenolepis diminuta TaxID=6216 RepID=A0A564YE20_HYMDI|nr:unnamed protein product [Hymenolepis diminuta]
MFAGVREITERLKKSGGVKLLEQRALRNLLRRHTLSNPGLSAMENLLTEDKLGDFGTLEAWSYSFKLQQWNENRRLLLQLRYRFNQRRYFSCF